MNEPIPLVLMILSCAGFFCLGGLWQARKVKEWRIRWIMLEYELARLQKRKPRDTSEVEHERP